MWLLWLLVALAAAEDTTTPVATTTTTESSTTTEAPSCPSDWVNAHSDGCFVFLDETNLTWVEAMMACEQVGGYLAEVKTTSQMELLLGLAVMQAEFTGVHNWWLGLTDLGREGSWEWQHSGEEVSEVFWTQGSPNVKPGNDLDCGYLQFSHGQLTWKDMDCRESKAHGGLITALCQTGEVGPEDPATETPLTTTSTTTQAAIECPDAWTQFEDSCYWIANNEAMTWIEAKESCNEFNPDAHLVFVKSEEEKSFLYSIHGSDSGRFWLGGTDSHEEGNWTWNDGTPFNYEDWYSDQPNGGQTQNCLAAASDYSFNWIDYECAEQLYFICEINLV